MPDGHQHKLPSRTPYVSRHTDISEGEIVLDYPLPLHSMSKGHASCDSSSSRSSHSTDYKSLRRCMEWRCNVDPTCPSDAERENLSTTNTWQENMIAPIRTMVGS